MKRLERIKIFSSDTLEQIELWQEEWMRDNFHMFSTCTIEDENNCRVALYSYCIIYCEL